MASCEGFMTYGFPEPEIETKNDLQPYTIIGYYDDEGKGFTEHVMAKNDNDSVVQFCKEREPKCDDVEARKYWRDNIIIVDVISGHVESRYDCGHICCASDWPGLTEGKVIT